MKAFKGKAATRAADELVIATVRRLTGLGQNEAKELVRLGKVTVGGRECLRWDLQPGPGVLVEVDTDRKRPSNRAKLTGSAIVYRDSVLLVVEKPSGVVSVPPTRTGEPTLLELLQALLTEEERNRGLVPVHRLDHGTSGLMVFGFRGPHLEQLDHLVSQHQMDRRYLALVEGVPREGVWESKLDVSRTRFGGGPQYRQARMQVSVIRSGGGISLVECRPQTGRYHQLRLQLSQGGHPILGDTEHVEKGHVWVARSRRLALHSHYLSLVHPASGLRLEYSSALPSELAEILEKALCREGE